MKAERKILTLEEAERWAKETYPNVVFVPFVPHVIDLESASRKLDRPARVFQFSLSRRKHEHR